MPGVMTSSLIVAAVTLVASKYAAIDNGSAKRMRINNCVQHLLLTYIHWHPPPIILPEHALNHYTLLLLPASAMSAQPGHTSNLRSGRPNAPIHVATQGGGRPRTMILGMAACALGFYGFYRLQFTTQNRSHTSADPAEMPTWQFRHAQQTPEFNERVSSPGGTGTNLRPRGSSAQEPTQFLHASPGRPSEGTQNENGHVGQPAPVKRMNDRGGIYTKNSDYKDSYRRD
ncbi:hypothetical protein ONZ51_g10782 [Trametes cubensis]|uniref:Uncharacterized protein n=1 Tax=Trametes cubensis TaxID=1111947 RepID=A0AAD7TLG3_9APHY|nr:hypothetical protein ONZ51_g10782 [Trametes cubensis]